MTTLQKNIKYYIYAAIASFFFSAVAVGTSMWNMYTFSVVQFIIYAIALSYTNYRKDNFFTIDNLIIITFLFLSIGVWSNLAFSQKVNENLFVFSEADAVAYFETGIELRDFPLSSTFDFLAFQQYDDWGGFFLTALVLRLIPSKIFLNIVFVLLGTLTSGMMFNIGRKLMNDKYAFLAALSFSISSFSIFFYSSALKEAYMICLVVAAVYYFYNYMDSKSSMNLLLSIVFTVLVVYFRPAVAYFMIIAGGITLVMSNSVENTKLYAILLVLGVSAAILWGSFGEAKDRYIGSTEEQYIQRLDYMADESVGTNSSLVVSAAATMVGPFPSLVPKVSDIGVSYISLYGPGLLFRLMLTLPFWLGVFVSIKNRIVKVFPLVIIPILEMLSLSIILEGLELRLSMPHMPFIFILAFWTMYIIDSKQWKVNRFIASMFNFWPLVVMGLAFLWNYR